MWMNTRYPSTELFATEPPPVIRGDYLQHSHFSYNNLFDNTAAREDLGFRVTIPWVEGARRTIKWLEENRMLEKCEDFPLYDRVIDAWRQATGNLTESFSQ